MSGEAASQAKRVGSKGRWLLNSLIGLFLLLAGLGSAFYYLQPGQDPYTQRIDRYLDHLAQSNGRQLARAKFSNNATMAIVIEVSGMSGCRAAYSDQMQEFVYQVVFGALNGLGPDLERAGEPNKSVWGKDLNQTIWDQACTTMYMARAEALECEPTSKSRFLIGLYTEDFYRRDIPYGESYAATLDLVGVEPNTVMDPQQQDLCR